MNMEQLNKLEIYEALPADELLNQIFSNHTPSTICFTCSFQAEDMIVLDLLRRRAPQVPVLFLETGYHFAETYEFRDQIARDWHLNLINVTPKQSVTEQESVFGKLFSTEPTKCCQLRKVNPLLDSLKPYDLWFTGLRR